MAWTAVRCRSLPSSAQEQIATFFASDGTEIIHPEPARLFEVAIQGPLPEHLTSRLQVSSDLPEAAMLVEELLTFQVKVTA
jgi:hypothetical protein